MTKQKKIWAIVAVCLSLAIILSICVPLYVTKKRAEDYTQQLREITLHIMTAAAEVRLLGQQIVTSPKEGFTEENIDSIRKKRQRADELMQALPAPKPEAEVAVSALGKLYEAYKALVDMALSTDKEGLKENLKSANDQVKAAYQEVEPLIQ